MKPNRGETKQDFLVRYTSALMAGGLLANAAEAKAQLAWDNSTLSHAGPSDTCCIGRTIEDIHINLQSYSIQVKKYNGRDHIVVPVTMLTEGVHAGSSGPIYYPAEEIAKFPAAWNDRAVPLYHPTANNGFPISAGSPEVLEAYSIGRVFNARAIDNGKKLVAELWLDVQTLSEKDPALLARINALEPIEVSTGLFLEEETSPGVWNGESYDSIAHNFRPDHLAVLPSGPPGACSINDGCGIRANAVVVEDGRGPASYLKESMYAYLLRTNVDPSYQEVTQMLREKLRVLDGKNQYHYIMDVYADSFYYEKENMDGPSTMYKQIYSMSPDKTSVNFEGAPVEVVLTKSYNPKTNSQGGINVDKKQMIEYLTANGCKIEKDVLEGMSDAALGALVGFAQDHVSVANALKAEKEVLVVENATLKTSTAPAPKAPTPEEFIANAPMEIQVTLNRALARDKKLKADLVSGLVKNQKAYNEAELSTMTLENLEKLATLAMPKDFSLRGGSIADPIAVNAITEVPLEVPTLNFALPSKK